MRKHNYSVGDTVKRYSYWHERWIVSKVAELIPTRYQFTGVYRLDDGELWEESALYPATEHEEEVEK